MSGHPRDRGVTTEVKGLDPEHLQDGMGSRYAREQPRASGKRPASTEQSVVKRARIQEGYVPSTRETKQAWEQLLNNISALLSDDEQAGLHEAAEEIMRVMKDETLREVDKKGKVEEVMGVKVSEDYFMGVLRLSQKLSDYREHEEEDAAMSDEEGACAVVFDDEEDDQGEDEDMDADDDVGEGISKALQDEPEQGEKGWIDAKSIDDSWIQRNMPKLSDNEEAEESQRRADAVFEEMCNFATLADPLGNKLLKLFKYKTNIAGSFIDACKQSREKIVYCMRLARANAGEKKQIKAELSNEDFGPAILKELETEAAEENTNSTFEREILKDRKKSHTDMIVQPQHDIPDLEDLTLDERHVSKSKAPPGTVFAEKKGYHEYHIPPHKRKPFRVQDELPISELPLWSRAAFKGGVERLNVVQAQCKPVAFDSDQNMLLCAPTGAGKTNVALLSILREVGKCVPAGSDEVAPHLLSNIKIVYIAPMKALVQEVVTTFGETLAPFGIQVSELTGDSGMTTSAINASHMIVSTPEKWDIVTRKSGDKSMNNVSLLIIDEIHLLHDSRGPVLEAIAARTIRNMEDTQEVTRLVGLSATLPNYKDVARFLRVKESGLMHFDGSFRPIPLYQEYLGITEKKQLKRRNIMNEIVYDRVMKVAGQEREQVMVFVHSRKDTAATARAIRDKALEDGTLGTIIPEDGMKKESLEREAETAKDTNLRNLIPYGFAIHHAGLTREDRLLVETLFKKDMLKVLVSTATLAWGVNLPAYCVIIKGTQVYNPEKGKWTELSSLDVMQMIGRAGRRQRGVNLEDQKGLGIIITSESELEFYLSLLNEQLPIESHFIAKLTEQLNAEIVNGSIHDKEEAVRWLGYTYLYIRMLRNPKLYKISDLKSDPELEKRRDALIHKAASSLEKSGLVKYDRRTGAFMSTDLGRVASYYYLTIGTIQKFNEFLTPNMHEIDILRLFSMADEFKYMSVREEEKLELAKLLETVPVPVKEDMDNPLAKVNVLLQSYISQRKLEGFSIMSDMVYIKQSATRVLRAMHEIVLKRGWAALTEKLLNLSKMVEQRLWLSQSPLRQFKSLKSSDLTYLERKNISWDRFLTLSTNDLSTILDSAVEAKKLYRRIHTIPKMTLEPSAKPITRSMIRVELVIIADFQYERKVHGGGETFHVIVEDPDGEQILHHEPFILKEKSAREEHVLYFYVPMYDPMPPQYFIKIVSDRWLWSETTMPLAFNNLILPEKAAPHTDLMDTSLHSASVLREFQSLYPNLKQLNSIQTQVFQSLSNTDDNVLVCAPAGSGKTLCGELALMRMLSIPSDKEPSAVYIAPKQDTVNNVYKDWVKKFSTVKVVKLTGVQATDVLILEGRPAVVCATAKQWDVLSRKWSDRKRVVAVKLYIVDDLHHLDTRDGPTLEVIVSRMRFIDQQPGGKNRIVGLSQSLLPAREVSKWIGATEASTFNFHSTARPVPLEIRMRTFDQPGFSARSQAMYRPTYLSLLHHAGDHRQVIIFVPSKKITFEMVVQLMKQSIADNTPDRFLITELDDSQKEKVAKKFSNDYLRKAVMQGIGFYDASLSAQDEENVTMLYERKMLQIMVCPQELCYRLPVRAPMVILAGTQYYDGKEHRHVDYLISDMQEMLGKAGTQDEDASALAYIMCYGPKKASLKKILNEPYPAESMLEADFLDALNAEVSSGVVVSKQSAVDYLTYTYLYKRLRQNPNYYGMDGTSQMHMNDFLSRLVEDSVETLIESGCIEERDEDDEASEDEPELSVTNFGTIAAHFYISYTTIEKFASSVGERTNIRDLIEIVSSASEFSDLIIRHHDERYLETLSKHVEIKQKELKFDSPHTKASILLHAHFTRRELKPEMDEDRKRILPVALSLSQALVSVMQSMESQVWLKPMEAAMELCQMIVQGMWDKYNPVLQLPHVTKEIAAEWKKKGVTGIQELVDQEDDDRDALLARFSPKELHAITEACNEYPSIETSFEVSNADDLHEGGEVQVRVVLQRDDDVGNTVPKVRSVIEKKEEWWVVIGDPAANVCYGQKKVSFGTNKKTTIKFTAPKQGKHALILSLVSDSYLGCDQELDLEINVLEPEDDEDEDESMEE